MNKNFPQTSTIGAMGEHFVLSQLLKQNFVAGLAPQNTKDYDIVVLNKDGNIASPIQVKTALYSETSNPITEWMLRDKHEIPIKNLVFCFVRMNLDSNKTQTYIIDAKKVSYLVKTCHKIWLKVPGIKNNKHNDTSMRKMMSDFRRTLGKRNYDKLKDYLTKDDIDFIKKYSDGWLKEHENNWEIIKIKI